MKSGCFGAETQEGPGVCRSLRNGTIIFVLKILIGFLSLGSVDNPESHINALPQADAAENTKSHIPAVILAEAGIQPLNACKTIKLDFRSESGMTIFRIALLCALRKSERA